MHPHESLLLSIDQGTTSTRAILFRASGEVLGIAQKEIQLQSPEPGMVLQDPLEILQSVRDTLRMVLHQTQTRASDIAAIGITNQRETTVVWDAEGRPVYPAIVWQSRQTANIVREWVEDKGAAWFHERTGLWPDAYFSSGKIAWMMRHVDGVAAKAMKGQLRFGTIDSWILWNLGREKFHRTDATNASRTMLYHLEKGDWDEELLHYCGIPNSMLPEIVDSNGDFGHLDPSILGHPIPIRGVAGDQQAALIGQGCIYKGQAKNTYGTGCFLLLNTGNAPVWSQHGLLSTVAWSLNGTRTFALEGSVFMAGALIQWLRDGLRILPTSHDSERLARECDTSEGVVIVPAFTGLGAPHWNPHARGTILGLTRGSGIPQICRAALEAIALQNEDLMQAMHDDLGSRPQLLRVDGGASQNTLLMQLQADICGIPLEKPVNSECTAWGAAVLAGLGVGVYSSPEDAASRYRIERRYLPQNVDVRQMKWRWTQALKAVSQFEV